MEIKKVNNLSNSYPRRVEISKSTLDNNLLNKWKIVGLSSIILNGLIELYASNVEAYERELAGDVEYVGGGIIENINTEYTEGKISNYNTSENNTMSGKTRANSTIMRDTLFSIVVIIVVIVGGFFYFSKQRFRIEADYSDDSGDNDE